LSELSSLPTNNPATIALDTAAIGLIIAIKGPSRTYDTDTESTPVSGVDTRNAVVALFEPPALLSPTAAGITPQEHKGIGAPIKAAFIVVQTPSLPKCFCKKFFGMKTFNKPANNNPSISQGAETKNKDQKLESSVICSLQSG
jgi:hypothetical protein